MKYHPGGYGSKSSVRNLSSFNKARKSWKGQKGSFVAYSSWSLLRPLHFLLCRQSQVSLTRKSTAKRWGFFCKFHSIVEYIVEFELWRTDLEIKTAVKQLHPIQIEEVIAHLVREEKRLRAENLELKSLLNKAVKLCKISFNWMIKSGSLRALTVVVYLFCSLAAEKFQTQRLPSIVV